MILSSTPGLVNKNRCEIIMRCDLCGTTEYLKCERRVVAAVEMFSVLELENLFARAIRIGGWRGDGNIHVCGDCCD